MSRFGMTAWLMLFLPAASFAQGWGSIEGQIVLDGDVPAVPPLVEAGDPSVRDSAVCAAVAVANDAMLFDKETKGIANVVVFLRRAPAEIHPELKVSKEKEVVFDQKNCRFLPHMMVVRTDQTVLVKSSDSIFHNVHTLPLAEGNNGQNASVQPNDQTGTRMEMKNAEALPVKVVCDIHSRMVAWWVVVDHPYAAVTDATGKFKIENLPAGEHEFRVWQETAGYINRTYKVTVKAGETVKLEPVKVPLGAFQKE